MGKHYRMNTLPNEQRSRKSFRALYLETFKGIFFMADLNFTSFAKTRGQIPVQAFIIRAIKSIFQSRTPPTLAETP